MNVTLEGKIGRLGTALREEVNRRLGDGQKAAKVAAWLNSLREVQAVLAAEFKGTPVKEKNLFKWRKFGFKNWLRRREADAMAGEIGELPVGDTAAVTEQIAGWASVRYLMTVRELVDRRCENGPRLKALREFCRDVLALRRSDYYDARLQLEKERLACKSVAEDGARKKSAVFSEEIVYPPASMSKLLLIDDEEDVRYSIQRIFDSPDIELSTASSGEEALKVIPKIKPDLVLMDVRMTGGMTGLETLRRLRQNDPKLLVILMTAYGTTQTAIEAMKLGAYDYLLKPFDIPKLKEIVANAFKAARDMKQVVSYEPLLESEDYELGIVGRSEIMQQVFKLIGQVAASDATALITGESGTGKELVARAIYHHSNRNTQQFLAVNCAAIPEQLLESELFGHEKGSFTGATNQRIGKFEQCNRGTIFLDEIGDMTPPTQTKILRVLQSGTFERVGGNEPLKVDVRVIAATNKPLEAAVAARQFREDLFYRLNVVRIQIPPLRDRREDIPLLVNYFLKKLAREQARGPKSIAASVIKLLEKYHWPGNVRELENAIRRAHVLAKSDAILQSDLPPEISGAGSMQSVPGVAGETASSDAAALARQLFQWAKRDPKLKVIPAVERELVIQALKETNDNQVHAAKLLGITRATLRKRIEKFGIQRELSVK